MMAKYQRWDTMLIMHLQWQSMLLWLVVINFHVVYWLESQQSIFIISFYHFTILIILMAIRYAVLILLKYCLLYSYQMKRQI